jgi:hypothetical protein
VDNSLNSEENKIGFDPVEKMKLQIKELSEKLIFANETIALIEDQNGKKAEEKLSQSVSEDDDEAYNESPSAKMVGKMISQARKKLAIGSSSTLGGPEDLD